MTTRKTITIGRICITIRPAVKHIIRRPAAPKIERIPARFPARV